MKWFSSIVLISIASVNLIGQVQWTKHPDNPVMLPGAEGEWDEMINAPGSVIFHEDTYHMWYWGGHIENVKQRIGHATSPDGINWTKDVNNPILEPGPGGTWDGTAVGDPTVIYNDSIFHMWYEGIPNKNLSSGLQIGHATSPDGVNWTKDHDNPVLELGPNGSWDDQWVSQPEVIYNGREYHMWYTAYNGTGEQIRIGHAVSLDGSTWTKDPMNPVLSNEAGSWDYPRVDFPKVTFDGASYHMWYAGGAYVSWDIGYATSQDGSEWEKYGTRPVLQNGASGSWDSKFTAFSPVIDSAGTKYKMWYLGGENIHSTGIGYAESIPPVHIPDTAFLNALIEEGVDTNGDGQISYAEAEVVTYLDLSGKKEVCWLECFIQGDIISLEGIEAFYNLDSLDCSKNRIENLDVSNNTALTYLNCATNPLDSLDLSNNGALIHLECGGNQFSLDISNNTSLIYLDCGSMQLTRLDVSKNIVLEHLNCSHNQLTSLDLSNNSALTHLECNRNYNLSSLDISTNTSLTYLDCSSIYADSIQQTSLDLSNNIALTHLYCAHYPFTYLDLSKNVALTHLSCRRSNLISLDLSNNQSLIQLECQNSLLQSLDLLNNDSLAYLDCRYNRIGNLDLSNNTSLAYLDCSLNRIGILDLSNNAELEFLYAASIYLRHIDLTTNSSLIEIDLRDNRLTDLDLPESSVLTKLRCDDNRLRSLDISNNTALTHLDCSNNQLANLDLSNDTALTYLDCHYNYLTEIDLSTNVELENLGIGDNLLTSLDISKNTVLKSIDISRMWSLSMVCVGEGFHINSVDIQNEFSPNAYFTTECIPATGIQFEDKNEFNIYPNPTNDFLSIETEYPDHYSIEITNLKGQQILVREMKGCSHQLSLSAIQKGVYFITIRSKDFVTTRKIIKL